MIVLTTSVQQLLVRALVRDKARALELLIEGPVIHARGTRDRIFILARARVSSVRRREFDRGDLNEPEERAPFKYPHIIVG